MIIKLLKYDKKRGRIKCEIQGIHRRYYNLPKGLVAELEQLKEIDFLYEEYEEIK